MSGSDWQSILRKALSMPPGPAGGSLRQEQALREIAATLGENVVETLRAHFTDAEETASFDVAREALTAGRPVPCGAVQPLLVAFLDKEALSESERAVIGEHLWECVACQRESAALARVGVVADAWQLPTDVTPNARSSPDATEALADRMPRLAEIWQAREATAKETAASDVEQHKSELPSRQLQAARRLAEIEERIQRNTPAPNRVTDWHSDVGLGDLLIRKGVLTEDQLAEAREVQRTKGGAIGNILRDLGYATAHDVAQARASTSGYVFIDLRQYKPEPDALSAVPASLARRRRILPLRKEGNRLWVAIADPSDVAALDAVRFATRLMVAPLAVEPEALAQAIMDAYSARPDDHTGRVPPTPPPTAVGAPADGPDDHGPVLGELLTTLRDLRQEVHAVHAEMEAMRAEMADLRRQLARARARAESPGTSAGGATRLMPFAPPADAPPRRLQ